MLEHSSPLQQRSPLSLCIGALLFLILPVTGGNGNNGNGNNGKGSASFFSDGTSPGNGNAYGKINNGRPVPKMKKDKDSKDFLKSLIAEDALLHHNKNIATSLDDYDHYAGNLADVLSQLSEAEQQEVFYGGGGG